MITRALVAVLVLLLLLAIPMLTFWSPGTSPPPGASAGRPWFVEVGRGAGLDRPLVYGDADKRTVLEFNGAGVGLLDYDGDGRLDLYLPQGGTLDVRQVDVVEHRPGDAGAGTVLREPHVVGWAGRPNLLYRSLGDGRFRETAAAAGVDCAQWGQGVAVGDYDADGRPDLFLSNLGPNRLYRNLGGGRFQDVAPEAGLDYPNWAASAAFLDADADGDLDLAVAYYLEPDLRRIDEHYRFLCPWKGVQIACGPDRFVPEPVVLYLHDGRFPTGGEPLARPAGLTAPTYPLGLVPADLDADGDMDLVVACDAGPDLAYENTDGRMTEVSRAWGLAVAADGGIRSGMGVDAADLDGDGRPEVFVTNYSEEHNTLRHAKELPCRDVTDAAGLADRRSWWGMGWGTKFMDYDHDGWLDLLVLQGHLFPQADELHDPDQTWAQPNLLYRGLPDGRFREVGRQAGLRALPDASSRGLAVGDIDDDGDLDWVETVMDGPPRLWINRRGNERAWITVRLAGLAPNTEGIGARVSVTVEGRTQHRWVGRGGSFQSSSEVRAHFGLGEAAAVERLEVRWPALAGRTPQVTVLQDLPARAHYTVRQTDGGWTSAAPSPGW